MTRARHTIPAHARDGFSLIELLVVIGIIVILIGILIPASTLVLGGARESSNRALLRTLADGTEAFYNDHRYHPPLLAPDIENGMPSEMYAPDHVDSSRPAATRQAEMAATRWHSVISPAVYLLGVGEIAPDPGLVPTPPAWLSDELDPNYPNRNDGADGLGIRSPGPDRSWGGAVTRTRHKPTFAGRVYGPYIDAKIGETQVREARLEDFTARTVTSPPLTQDDVDRMGLLVIIDRYDSPIRYYKDWPERDRMITPDATNPTPKTAIDTPLELISHEALLEYRNPESEPTTFIDTDLFGRSAAFLSAGPDARWGERRREEIPQDRLLVGREIRTLFSDNSDTALRTLLDAHEDNQRVTAE